MAIDLTQFHEAFFEESFESLDNMENGLLGLEIGGDNTEIIGTVFRGAHSIKGGSATFGFDAVAAFTHVMETLMDEMRAGHKEATTADVGVLLASVDCLREMLRAVQSNSGIDQERVADLQARLEAALDGEKTPTEAKDDAITEDEFEQLLDDLHGKDSAPGALKKEGAVARKPPDAGRRATPQPTRAWFVGGTYCRRSGSGTCFVSEPACRRAGGGRSRDPTVAGNARRRRL